MKPIVYFFIFLLIISCKKDSFTNGSKDVATESPKIKSVYQIVIVTDTIDEWSIRAKEGIVTEFDRLLAESGVEAKYTVYDTELDPAKAESIVTDIKAALPDLIFTLNFPDSFADLNVSKKLTDFGVKIISMNPVPVEAGIIESLSQPGGNITGVGIFLQMNSPIRLMKMLNPNVKKLAFYSWDIMTLVNDMLKKELVKSCEEEGIEFVEFYKAPDQESILDFFKKYDTLNAKSGEYFLMVGISAFVKRDGSPADDKIEAEWLRQHSIPLISYDETTVENGNLAGVTTIWSDIGVQLAEKGKAVLIDGKDTALMSWDYPRKYNLLFNKKRSDFLGLTIPENLLSASYRVYTDYEGNYAGVK